MLNTPAAPRISVIIPAWNAENFLADTLKSVQEQTMMDWEIIVVNDGSIDGTTEIVKRMQQQDARIRYVFQENQGLAASRNHGLRLAKGKFIQFLDADDQLIADKFERQLNHIASHPDTDVIYGDCELVYIETGQHVFRGHTLKFGSDPLDDLLRRWPKGESIPIHCALFRRSVLDKENWFDEELKAKEDWLFWVDIILQEPCIVYTPGVVALYIQHADNMCKNTDLMEENERLTEKKIAQRLPIEESRDFTEIFE